MHPSQVIIRPVVSEKSYVLATADKYTFRVHPDAHKTQIKQAIEALFDVQVLAVRTQSVPSKPKRRGLTTGRTRAWKKAVVQVAEARPSRSSRASRPTSSSHADPQAQAHLPRTPLRLVSRLRGDHEDAAGEDPRRGAHEVRRAQLERPQDVPPPRRRRQAAVP